MGTWGTGWFENDSAADFVDDLEDAQRSQRPALITARLQAVADHGGYIERPEADDALAAAALVALAGGAGAADDTEGEVASSLPTPDEATLTLARSVVARLSSPIDNEWFDLWSEAGEAEAATARLAELQQALAAVVPAASAGAWAAGDPPAAPRSKRRWWKR